MSRGRPKGVVIVEDRTTGRYTAGMNLEYEWSTARVKEIKRLGLEMKKAGNSDHDMVWFIAKKYKRRPLEVMILLDDLKIIKVGEWSAT